MAKKSQLTGWIRDGALWGYKKPKTKTGELLERVHQAKELRKRWRERIGEAAFKCPKCGDSNYFEWLIGWWPDEEHYHDPNRKECVTCGHWWWIACPTCGHNEGRTKESYFKEHGTQIKKYKKE